MMRLRAASSSTQKSRSLTPSRLFRATSAKPRAAASMRRSVSKVVPARAQQPMGLTLMRFRQSARRSRSRSSIMA